MPVYDYDSVDLPDATSEGGRNDTMFRWLCSQRAKGADDSQIAELAEMANASRMVPPMDNRELHKLVGQACEYEAGPSGYNVTPRPMLSEPDIPVFDDDVNTDVLHDLSWMTPVNQAKVFLCACFDIYDVVCITGNLTRRDANQFRYVGYLLGGFDGEELPLMFDAFNQNVGGYICVNPLKDDATNRKNVDVSRYDNALIECDDMDKEYQLKKMLDIFWNRNNVIKAIVDSGNKSYHCVVEVGAKNKQQYDANVSYLHALCEKNGLHVDHACRNEARLMRLPGVMRNGSMQKLVYADPTRHKATAGKWASLRQERR